MLGRNGEGKSTLFKTILGLLPPRAGVVWVDGAPISGWSPRRRALTFGYVPQHSGGTFPFTVAELVLMGRTAYRGAFAAPSTADRRAADEAIAVLGIEHLAEREWLRVSGGERQLAVLARALAQEPRILVLDEPTASLDFGNQVRVLDAVRGLAETHGLSVLLSTHHPEQAFACADRVGRERGQPFIGQSLIVSHTGWPVAGPASPTEEEIIVARVNLADARRKRNWNAFNQVLRDRRTDLYDEMLGSEHRPGWY